MSEREDPLRYSIGQNEWEELQEECDQMRRERDDLAKRCEILNDEINDLMSFMECCHRKANMMYNEGTDYDEDICHACWTQMRHAYTVAEAVRMACEAVAEPQRIRDSIRTLDLDAIVKSVTRDPRVEETS